jgi:hypothetical protein
VSLVLDQRSAALFPEGALRAAGEDWAVIRIGGGDEPDDTGGWWFHIPFCLSPFLLYVVQVYAFFFIIIIIFILIHSRIPQATTRRRAG